MTTPDRIPNSTVLQKLTSLADTAEALACITREAKVAFQVRDGDDYKLVFLAIEDYIADLTNLFDDVSGTEPPPQLRLVKEPAP